MSLIQPATLADRLGVSASDVKVTYAISAAEQLVAEYIGARSLAEASRTEKIRPPRDRETVEVSHGPMTALTSVTVDGTAQDVGDFLVGYWGLGISDPEVKWAANKTVSLAYTSGWANEAALPLSLKEAILIVGQQSYTRDPTGRLKASESIGDFSVSWVNEAQSGLNPIPITATTLLTAFKRPQL
jgi:hypothetical protein